MGCRIKKRPYKACIGKLNVYITIRQKIKSSTNLSGLNSTITLSAGEGTWAFQKSVNGEEIFDGINMVGRITDHFYIRYNPQSSLDKTYLIELEGNRYNIEQIVPNVEGERELTLLKCSINGDATLESTKL
jgi:SPP1 family predicted phage head-tail adaptor